MADANASSLLLVFRHAPYGRSLSRAGYDLALAAAAFDQPVSLLFMDDGIWQLLPEQHAAAIHARSVNSTLASLPLYDIDRLYVATGSLASRGLDSAELVEGVVSVNDEQIRDLMADHQQVLVF